MDGWRALSIFIVLGAHSRDVANFPQQWKEVFLIFNGNLGVRTFFVISGLLITWLILKEDQACGKIDLRSFYIRRALRILPVYVMFLFVIALLQIFTPFQQSSGAWLANLTFTTGLAWWHDAICYTTFHLWSLAVEEQFYLVWPFLMVFLLLSSNVHRAIPVLLVPVVAAPIARVISYLKLEPDWASSLLCQFSFLTNFDAIAIGCLAAFLLHRKRDGVQRVLIKRFWLFAYAGLMMVILPEVLSRLFLVGIFTVPLGKTVQAVGLAMLILQSVLVPEKGPYKMMNTRPIMWIGALSYSLYIWQQLFCSSPAIFGWPNVWWMTWPGWLGATFLVASLSYYCLERPVSGLRSRFRPAA